jgi:hypothetical protein
MIAGASHLTLLFSYDQFVEQNQPRSKMQLLQCIHNQQLGAVFERRWFVYQGNLIPGPENCNPIISLCFQHHCPNIIQRRFLYCLPGLPSRSFGAKAGLYIETSP